MWGPFRVACCRYTWGNPATCQVFYAISMSVSVVVSHRMLYYVILKFRNFNRLGHLGHPRSCLDWGSTGAATTTSSRLTELCRTGRWTDCIPSSVAESRSIWQTWLATRSTHDNDNDDDSNWLTIMMINGNYNDWMIWWYNNNYWTSNSDHIVITCINDNSFN